MQKTLKHKIIKAASITLAVILVCIGGFFLYVSDYYRADETAQALAQEAYITNTDEGDYILPAKTGETTTGFIFYPGAKVDTKAYLPLLDSISSAGINCYLIDMPFHFAFFDANAADRIINDNPQITQWYIGGHSLGGAIASQYAYNHQDTVAGLILLSAYPYKNYPIAKTLTIYGSLETRVAEKIDYEENVYVIDGANHAQFGNYGKQDGDVEAEISAEEQQLFAVAYILSFILFNGH